MAELDLEGLEGITGGVGGGGNLTRYVVKPGDTLVSICKRFDLELPAVARINGIRNEKLLYVGQILLLDTRARKTTSI